VRGEPPLLLLDEIGRSPRCEPARGAIRRACSASDSQTWLTGTDEALFAPLRCQAQFLSVHDGNLAPDLLLTRETSTKDEWRTHPHPTPMAHSALPR